MPRKFFAYTLLAFLAACAGGSANGSRTRTDAEWQRLYFEAQVERRLQVSVTESGAKVDAPERAEDCQVLFFRTQRPQASYVEMCTLHIRSISEMPQSAPREQHVQERIRREACSRGADAVIITDEVYGVLHVGTRATATLVKLLDPTKPKPAAPGLQL